MIVNALATCIAGAFWPRRAANWCRATARRSAAGQDVSRVLSGVPRDRPKVLFVSHEATRTGAPVVLLHLLRWLKANARLDLEVLSLRDGPLLEDFAAVAPSRALFQEHPRFRVQRVLRRTIARRAELAWNAQLLRRKLSDRSYDLLYLNSAACAPFLEYALGVLRPVPVVAHIHELDMGLELSLPEADRRRLFDQSNMWIAASQPVADVIRRLEPESPDGVVVQEFIDTRAIRRHAGEGRAATLAELGVPDGSRIVGACGTLDYRKGADLFVQLAQRWLAEGRAADVFFVWLGGQHSGFFHQVQLDARRAGVADRMRWIPSVPDPHRYLTSFDVFCLTSREDPFPLVCLEAAALERPIPCFDSAGGMPDFVERDAGTTVAYLDIVAMAAAIDELLDDDETRMAMGKRAAEKVQARNDTSVLAPRIQEVIEGLLATLAAPG
jgi:glycosyltransferase involved in cell wall biosynthesis